MISDPNHAPSQKIPSCPLTFEFSLHIFQQDPDDLDNRDDQRPERDRPQMVPDGPPERLQQRERRDVSGLGEGPVVRGESSGQRDLAEGDHKVHEPEEHEEVEELHVDDVLVDLVGLELAAGGGVEQVVVVSEILKKR